MTRFYAWVTPAFVSGAPVDHTWVTTYDSTVTPYDPINDVTAHGEDYWYSWGTFHATGKTPKYPTGLIESGTGDSSLAACIALANKECKHTSAARGTIASYGVDGVCHQLSNQILYATKSVGKPLLVDKARGYWASSALYGTYGVDHAAWLKKLASCAKAIGLLIDAEGSGGLSMFAADDDFAEHARNVLGEDPVLLELLRMRVSFQEFLNKQQMLVMTADAMNERNQRFFDQALHLLGPERFERVFGYDSEQKINLVDPIMVDDQRFDAER